MKSKDEGMFQLFGSMTHEELFYWMSVKDGDWRKRIEVDLRKLKINKIKNKISNI